MTSVKIFLVAAILVALSIAVPSPAQAQKERGCVNGWHAEVSSRLLTSEELEHPPLGEEGEGQRAEPRIHDLTVRYFPGCNGFSIGIGGGVDHGWPGEIQQNGHRHDPNSGPREPIFLIVNPRYSLRYVDVGGRASFGPSSMLFEATVGVPLGSKNGPLIRPFIGVGYYLHEGDVDAKVTVLGVSVGVPL